MANINCVHSLDCLTYLAKELPDTILRKSPFDSFRLYILVERHSVDILLNEVNISSSLEVFYEFYYIGVIQFLHISNFSLNSFPFIDII